MTRLSPAARAYVGSIVAAGAAIGAFSLLQLYVHGVDKQWFILVGLTLLTGSFTIRISSLQARVSVSETFVFASVLLFGPSAGTVTVILETLVISFWQNPKTRSAHRVLFNIAAPSIAIWLSSQAFFWFSGIGPQFERSVPLPVLFVPLGLFTTLYFLLNTWLVAIALGLERGRSPLEIWWPNFTWVAINYFSGASVAALLVAYSSEIHLSTLIIIVPLLVISYLTFRTAMARVDDATTHLAELNKLYLSTIETLAMAIDAKDQITHGHIRRVQSYAVGLARKVGIKDDRLIRAIEAAALLHDMGKLAVPEYILNKPGKLTPAEFEKMKAHAGVGADILSAIEFPYPVVPIVRHHHENWDGTGYPTGIKGTDIPIGARILSVVDCFDALTSDRPYRPKLSDDAALAILRERSGNMYDPLIVETFMRVYQTIGPESHQTAEAGAFKEIADVFQQPPPIPSPRLEDIAASADEMLSLFDLARAMAGRANLSDVGNVVAKHLRRLIPHSLCVLYLYNAAADDLEAKCAIGEAESVIRGLVIPRGQRLSGWVAANRQTIVNSDPSLDLGEGARRATPRLRSCLSTPLLFGDQLVGVLTLYSSALEGFGEDHRRIIEAVASQLAHTFKSAAEFEKATNRDQVTGLPTLGELERLLEGTRKKTNAANVFLLVIDIEAAGRENSAAMSEIMRLATQAIRTSLQQDDVLFQVGDRHFVVLVSAQSQQSARSTAERIEAAFHDSCHCSGPEIRLTVTVVNPPEDTTALRNLLTGPHSGSSRSHIVH